MVHGKMVSHKLTCEGALEKRPNADIAIKAVHQVLPASAYPDHLKELWQGVNRSGRSPWKQVPTWRSDRVHFLRWPCDQMGSHASLIVLG
jgi:hypothetical protein